MKLLASNTTWVALRHLVVQQVLVLATSLRISLGVGKEDLGRWLSEVKTRCFEWS